MTYANSPAHALSKPSTALWVLLWLPTTSLAEADGSTADNSLWVWNGLPPTTWLLVILTFGVATILGIGIYRVLLKTQVVKGIHPQVFSWTVIYIASGLWLLTVFQIIFGNSPAGIGYFVVFIAIYILSLLFMLMLRRIMMSSFIILVIIIGFITFHLIDNNII